MTYSRSYLIHAPWAWAIAEEDIRTAYPPIVTRINFNDFLWVERLDHNLATRIMDACEPTGFDWKPTRQYGHVYAFVYDGHGSNNHYVNESPKYFREIMALSRLIHPTSIGYEYCATVLFDDADEVKRIIPADVRGRGGQMHVLDNKRDWLTLEEAESLKVLYRKYKPDQLKGPIKSAFWYHEYSHWEYYIEFRWLFICAALEGLVNNSKKRVTKQFTYRIKTLGEHINHPISEHISDKFYDMRSKLIHGDLGENWDHDNNVLYQKLEQFISAVIRKAIEEPELASLLSNSQNVADMWPLPPKSEIDC